MKIKPTYLIGGAIILAALIFGFTAFQGALTPYVTAANVAASKGRVQLSGLMDGTPSRDAAGNIVFSLKDDKGHSVKVVYNGPALANLDTATGAVAIGQYKEGAFHADQVMLKCPSKYEEKYVTPASGQK